MVVQTCLQCDAQALLLDVSIGASALRHVLEQQYEEALQSEIRSALRCLHRFLFFDCKRRQSANTML
jgi:hypothetical protein